MKYDSGYLSMLHILLLFLLEIGVGGLPYPHRITMSSSNNYRMTAFFYDVALRFRCESNLHRSTSRETSPK
jgi:hypothetical protein